jgi:hypothetical protein
VLSGVGRSLRRTDHSARGVLPTVARRVCDLENLVNEEAIAHVGLQRHIKKYVRLQLISECFETFSVLCISSFLNHFYC